MGGPRLWRERSRERRRWVSARWEAVKVVRWSRVMGAGGTSAAELVAGAVVEGCGKLGQVELTAGAPLLAAIMPAQWWAPLRRQQAGRWVLPESCAAASADAATGRPKATSRKMARMRRIAMSVAGRAEWVAVGYWLWWRPRSASARDRGARGCGIPRRSGRPRRG